MKIGIVGAGINGTYLAWKLSKDHDVILFEKKKKIVSGTKGKGDSQSNIHSQNMTCLLVPMLLSKHLC